MTEARELPALPTSRSSGAKASGAAARPVRSEELLHGQREVLIAHGDEIYRLRLTRNGKLILTK